MCVLGISTMIKNIYMMTNWRVELPIENVIPWRKYLHENPGLSFEEFETTNIDLPAMMGSEDFSAYAEVAQGSFFALGGGSTEGGCTYSLHHPKFKVNEDTLVIGMQMHGQISLDVLSGEVTQKA